MRGSIALLVLAALLAAAVTADPTSQPAGKATSRSAQTTPALTDVQIERLVEQMDDDKYAVREAAHKKLQAVAPSIFNVLVKHADHPSAEVRMRVKNILDAYAWLRTGAIIQKVKPDSQAEKLGVKVGDVLLKVDQLDITRHQDLSKSSRADRVFHLRRHGRTITKQIPSGEAGIVCSTWAFAKGGPAHAEGVAAMADKQYDRAYELLREAADGDMDDAWTLELLIALAEYGLDHRTAMEVYGAVRNRLADDDCSWSHRWLAYSYHGLPMSGVHSDWLLRRMKEGKPGRALSHRGEIWFVNGGRNLEMLKRVSRRQLPNDASNHEQTYHRYGRVKMAWFERRWQDVLAEHEHVDYVPWLSREAIDAALYLGKTKACKIASRTLKAYQEGRIREYSASCSLAAVAAAVAINREELYQPLLEELERASLDDNGALLRTDMRYLYSHMGVNLKMAPLLGRLAARVGQEGLSYVYLDTLRYTPDLTIEQWTKEYARFGTGVERANKYVHWINAEALLRLGLYARARQAVKGFYKKYEGLGAFHRATDFLQSHAERLSGDWSMLKGVTQLYAGRAEGSHWAVRCDGRTFYIDPAGGVHEYPGLAPGQVHRGVCGDEIGVYDTGTIYVRRSQIYLLDAEAKRWIPTYASPCRVPANSVKWNDSTAPLVLKYILAEYPIRGPGREFMRRPIGVGDWRIYQFRGDLAIAVHPKTHRLIDISRQIGRLAGKDKPAAVSKIGYDKKDRPVIKDQRTLLPTDVGLWQMDAEGAITRVSLPTKTPSAPVSVLTWPRREGKRYIGVAPQYGGQIYELDVKTGQGRLTGGYCGQGPPLSFNWFVEDREEDRTVRGEYAIQALYEKRLKREKEAAKKKGQPGGNNED